MDEIKCKERVSSDTGFGFYPCSRKAWKDGYCKQHHPESVAKRQEESKRKYEEKKKQSAWYKLTEAKKRIKELEEENWKLKEMLNER